MQAGVQLLVERVLQAQRGGPVLLAVDRGAPARLVRDLLGEAGGQPPRTDIVLCRGTHLAIRRRVVVMLLLLLLLLLVVVVVLGQCGLV